MFPYRTFGGEKPQAMRLFASVATRFASKGVNSFFGDYRHHDESCGRIGPPPAEESVEEKSSKQNRRKIHAELRLARVYVHRCASNSGGNFSFCSRKQRHHDERNKRKPYANRTLRRRFAADERFSESYVT